MTLNLNTLSFVATAPHASEYAAFIHLCASITSALDRAAARRSHPARSCLQRQVTGPIPGRALSLKALHTLTYPSSPYSLFYRRSPVPYNRRPKTRHVYKLVTSK